MFDLPQKKYTVVRGNHMNRHLSESWEVVRWYGPGFETLVDAWVSVQDKRQRLGPL